MIKKQLKALKRENYSFVEDAGRGYRRVVPSPQPKSIVELASIKTLIENDVLVIAAGGGGVPVIANNTIALKVLMQLSTKIKQVLGADIQCDQLIILTAIDYVC